MKRRDVLENAAIAMKKAQGISRFNGNPSRITISLMKTSHVILVGSLLFFLGIVAVSICDQWPLFDTHQTANGHEYWAPDPVIQHLLSYGGLSLTLLGGVLIVLTIASQLIVSRQQLTAS